MWAFANANDGGNPTSTREDWDAIQKGIKNVVLGERKGRQDEITFNILLLIQD